GFRREPSPAGARTVLDQGDGSRLPSKDVSGAAVGRGDRPVIENDIAFVGNIDSISNDAVAGWIADPADPMRAFEVELLVDGLACGRVHARFPRPDVGEAGYGSGA